MDRHAPGLGEVEGLILGSSVIRDRELLAASTTEDTAITSLDRFEQPGSLVHIVVSD